MTTEAYIARIREMSDAAVWELYDRRETLSDSSAAAVTAEMARRGLGGIAEEDVPTATSPPAAPPARGDELPGGIIVLSMAGLLSLLVGLYYLVAAPDTVEGIANLHRLTMGETFTIVGAIFLAAAFRPYHRG